MNKWKIVKHENGKAWNVMVEGTDETIVHNLPIRAAEMITESHNTSIAKLNRVREIIQHIADPNEYFICGSSGNKDEYGLPDVILVCPAQGLDGYAIYEKASNYG